MLLWLGSFWITPNLVQEISSVVSNYTSVFISSLNCLSTSTSKFPSGLPRGTLRVSGKQNSLFPMGPVIKCLLDMSATQDESATLHMAPLFLPPHPNKDRWYAWLMAQVSMWVFPPSWRYPIKRMVPSFITELHRLHFQIPSPKTTWILSFKLRRKVGLPSLIQVTGIEL